MIEINGFLWVLHEQRMSDSVYIFAQKIIQQLSHASKEYCFLILLFGL